MTAAERRAVKERQNLGAAVLQTYQEIAAEKRAAGKRRRWVYWIDDDVAARVFRLMGWKPARRAAANERRMRMISGTVSGFVRRGILTVMENAPHGNRPLRVN